MIGYKACCRKEESLPLESGEESGVRNVYFVRYGETIWGVGNKICGATKGALTERGRGQARIIGKEIRARMGVGELQIDRMLCSPLSRARDAAQEIADILKLPLAIGPRLRGQNFGIWERTARDGEGFQRVRENFIDSFGTDESMLRLTQRVYNLLDDMRADAGHTYLLAVHNGTSHMMGSYSHGMDDGELASFGIRNATLRTYCYLEKA